MSLEQELEAAMHRAETLGVLYRRALARVRELGKRLEAQRAEGGKS